MLFKLLLIVLISQCFGESDVDYIDSVIDMLLNGVSGEITDSSEINVDEEPILSGGLWKCGNCTYLDESSVMYSEVNSIEDNMMTDTTVDIQIGFTLPGMRCVTVQSSEARLVRRVAGSCTSGTLTLSVAPTSHFTVKIYK